MKKRIFTFMLLMLIATALIMAGGQKEEAPAAEGPAEEGVTLHIATGQCRNGV